MQYIPLCINNDQNWRKGKISYSNQLPDIWQIHQPYRPVYLFANSPFIWRPPTLTIRWIVNLISAPLFQTARENDARQLKHLERWKNRYIAAKRISRCRNDAATRHAK